MLATLCVCSSLGDQDNKNYIFVVHLYIFLCVHVHAGGGWVNVCVCLRKTIFWNEKSVVDVPRPSL